METQFEITSRLGKKHYVEYFRCIWHRRLIWVVLFAIIGIVDLLLSLADQDTIYTIVGCYLIVSAIWLFFRPWLVAAKTVKRDLKFEGTEALESITKFGDIISDESAHQTATVQYDKIEKIHFAENVIVIRDIRKADLILDRNGFSKGTFEEFLPLIQEKCPQLKLPKW